MNERCKDCPIQKLGDELKEIEPSREDCTTCLLFLMFYGGMNGKKDGGNNE